MNETLRCALQYAAIGWRVIPLKRGGKVPYMKAWQKHATTDESTIRQWFRDNPGSNLGIACGRESGIYVIDFDTAKHPNCVAEFWSAVGDALSAQSRFGKVFTASGGQHWYLRLTPGGARAANSASKRIKGVDVRADGGQVVAPPSTIKGVPYEWQL